MVTLGIIIFLASGLVAAVCIRAVGMGGAPGGHGAHDHHGGHGH